MIFKIIIHNFIKLKIFHELPVLYLYCISIKIKIRHFIILINLITY